MNTNPEIEKRMARRALAVTRAGMLTADRAFLDIVEPAWDAMNPLAAEELLRTRLVLDRASADLEVYFGHDDRVMLKQHPSGAFVWVTLRGDAAKMNRRFDRALAQLAAKVAARGLGEVEAERQRAAARARADALVAELLPADVTARRDASGKVSLTSTADPTLSVNTWADGDNARAKVIAALARLHRKVDARRAEMR